MGESNATLTRFLPATGQPSPVSSSRTAKPPFRKSRAGQSWSALLRAVRRWRGGRRVRRKLAAAPPAVRIAFIVAAFLTAFFLANLVYQVVRKPTELLFFTGAAFDKAPAETWRQY